MIAMTMIKHIVHYYLPHYDNINCNILYFVDIGYCFVNNAIKTDCVKNKYMFQCTDDVNVVFNTAFIMIFFIN